MPKRHPNLFRSLQILTYISRLGGLMDSLMKNVKNEGRI
jgi:hypothetical protein